MGYRTSAAPDKISVIKSDYTVQEFNVSDIDNAVFDGAPVPSGFEAWKTGVTGPVNEIVLNSLSITDIAAGQYSAYVLVTPAGDFSHYYLWQTDFASPQHTEAALPLTAQPPVGELTFGYSAQAFPAINPDPSLAAPISIGPAALGGDTVSLQVSLGKFVSPVDIYVAYGVAAAPDKIYLMKSDYTIQAFSLNEISNAIYHAGPMPNGFAPWKQNVTGPINEILLNNVPVSQIPAGSYALYLMATPAGNLSNNTIWSTELNGTGSDGATLYSQNCAGCHGPLAGSTKAGRTVSQIRAAMSANLGGVMGSLNGLSDFQLQMISDALTLPTPPPMPLSLKTTDAATLYNQNCALCHGPSDTAFPAGVAQSQVQAAMNSVRQMQGVGLLLTPDQVSAVVNKIGSPSVTPTPTPTPGPTPTPPPTMNGAALYATNCSGCHGALAMSAKKGRTAAQISGAISSVGAMSGLSLTSAQISAIASALAGTTPMPTPTPTPGPTPPPTTNGATLYANNCSGCHGALATSSKRGRTAAQITSAISSVGQMSGLSLTSAQISAIASALAGTTPMPTPTPTPGPTPPPTTNGATLYANNCSGCHGALATSSKRGRTAAQITSAISSVSQMRGISLTSAQISAIASALSGTTPTPTPTPTPGPTPPPTTDGATLYANNCSGCHGALATSSKRGRTAAQITSAISSVSQMRGISLTSAQISAIASALAGTTPTPTPTPGPTSGATLYATYCAGCHGALASSQVGGASASEISSAIHGGVSQMSGLSSLTSTQISAIASALAGVRGSDSVLGQAAPSSGGLQPVLYARMGMEIRPSKGPLFLSA